MEVGLIGWADERSGRYAGTRDRGMALVELVALSLGAFELIIDRRQDIAKRSGTLFTAARKFRVVAVVVRGRGGGGGGGGGGGEGRGVVGGEGRAQRQME